MGEDRMKECVMHPLVRYGIISCALAVATTVSAAEIEAEPGKVYHLTRHHGPWMVMVASFLDTGPVPEESTSPAEAANALVLELRQRGLPAYVYEMDSFDSPVMTTNRVGEEEIRRPSHRYHEICVLAGNYRSLDDSVGQQTLAWIKRYQIESEVFGDVAFNPTPGQPGPLSGAFMTVNPMLSPEEVSAHEREEHFEQVASFNEGIPYSLLDNPGRYSLVVATFRGRTIHQGLDPSKDDPVDSRSATVRALQMMTGGSIGERAGLADAARTAIQLASYLRTQKDVEAYVWHDQFASMVTVGSFASQNDAAINTYRERFSSQPEMNASTGQMVWNVQFDQIPMDYGSNEYQMIVYDPIPQLMPVPGSND
jgi:hypothetical protein